MIKFIAKLGIASTCIALLMAVTETKPAQALSWNWSFNNGNEAGTFDTNGTYADTTGSFNFGIDVTKFTVTNSAFAPSIIGATFNEGSQPGTGFLWNGSAATQFYRANGTLTNGSNFFTSNYTVLLAVTSNAVGRITNNSNATNTGLQALTLTPVSTPVPFNFSGNLGLGIFGASIAGRLLLRKVRAAKKTVELT